MENNYCDYCNKSYIDTENIESIENTGVCIDCRMLMENEMEELF